MSSGGKREGSGRKQLPDDKKKKSIKRTFTIKKEVDKFLKTKKNRSVYINDLIKKDMSDK